MRLYSFAHSFLGPIHKGIQTAHVVSEMASKFDDGAGDDGNMQTFLEWAGGHKTIIILEGGNSDNMLTIRGMVAQCSRTLKLPYTWFCEDAETLNGMMTAVGIIVPAEIYEGEFCEAPMMTPEETLILGDEQQTKRILYSLIRTGRLAN